MSFLVNVNFKNCFMVVQEKIRPMTGQDGRIGWLACIAIGMLAACYAFHMVIKNFKRKCSKLGEKEDRQLGSFKDAFKGDTEKAKLVVGGVQKIPRSEGVTSRGPKAIEVYKRDPSQCSTMNRVIVFRDIKEINSTSDKDGRINSVEGLMLYHSGLDRVDLQNERCIQVAVDTIKECNKETSSRLVEWLIQQKNRSVEILLTPDALKLCLEAFIEKHETQQINLYALEQLIKTYRERKWNEVVNDEGRLILPLNHPVIVSAMSLLIKEDPNNNRIGTLAEWMMGQKDFDLRVFSDWVSIFKQKELDNPEVADKLYYPLLDKLIAHYKEKWGQPMLSRLPVDIADFVCKHIKKFA